MNRIVVTGLRGGVGATTVAANLAAALHAIEQQVHIIDLSPLNLLRLHFSMELANPDGWARRMLNGESWMQAGYQNARQVSFVPFGHLDRQQRDALIAQLDAKPAGLIDMFSVSSSADNQWQIILLPEVKLLEPRHYALLGSAQLVLCVTRPDIQSYVHLQQSHSYQTLLSHCQPRHVFNLFQANSAVSCDMLLVFQQELAEKCVPVVLHQDTALAEAIADLATVIDHAPYSQATHDYHALAFWCLSLKQQRAVNHV